VIATTRSAGKAAALRALGASEAIDVSRAGWVEEVMDATGRNGVDAIIDQVGGPMLADHIRVLAIKGASVEMAETWATAILTKWRASARASSA
jgi:NADPH2:quinone reductase